MRIAAPLLLLGAAIVGFSMPACGKKLWAKSYLNQKAPDFLVEKWLTSEPQREGKFLLVDFWATWCLACQESIGGLNEIHRELGDRLVVIGISDEKESEVRAMKEPKIEYSIAIDTKQRMKTALEVRGIPHVILVDPEGIVRWEGFPFLQDDPLTLKRVRDVVAKYSKR